MKRHATPLVRVALVAAFISTIISISTSSVIARFLGLEGSAPGQVEVTRELVMATVLSLLVNLGAGIVINGILANMLLAAARDEPPSWQHALDETTRRLPALAGLALLVVFATTVGFVLLFVPGIIVLLGSSVAVATLFAEDVGPVDAFRRSFQLVSRRWGATGLAWVLVVMLLIALALTATLLAPIPLIAAAASLAMTATSALAVYGTQVVLYLDLQRAEPQPA